MTIATTTMWTRDLIIKLIASSIRTEKTTPQGLVTPNGKVRDLAYAKRVMFTLEHFGLIVIKNDPLVLIERAAELLRKDS